ncbi:unnamed protein product [Mytilus coruscus]|uniref:NAD-dependent epimerase/dehydratase domain-containing protein n=1 Tax=Mytilus coruscus TaxID=42192 RepID=A0A6J8B2V1_MYTCO|nr:unnamed protein product [Mytilus coruscus]
MEMLMKLISVFLILAFCIIHVISDKPLNILVFGGNGFIGAETVERILSENHKVTLVNRGNWYWDSGIKIKPFVQHITCDRTQPLKDCNLLQSFLLESGDSLYFDFVIDFSGYFSFQIKDVLETFQNQIGKYIFISSDSVYEVCKEKHHYEFTVETDAVRPTDEKSQQELNEKDDYGHQKLECEEELIKDGVPFLILRLPDVIGPRDNTLRWWIYQLWIKLSDYLTHPITIPKRLFYTSLSFVYVQDVSDLIVNSLSFKPGVFNEAYNLAFSETKTLYQLLSHIRDKIGKGSTNILLSEQEGYMYFFPSVTLGPINIDKAKERLGWNPSPFETAAEKITMFYENAISNKSFTVEADRVIKKIQQYFTENSNDVYNGLYQEYGITGYHIKQDL